MSIILMCDGNVTKKDDSYFTQKPKRMRKVIKENFPWLDSIDCYRGTPATLMKWDRECVYSFVFAANTLLQIDKFLSYHNAKDDLYEFEIMDIKFTLRNEECLNFFIGECSHWYNNRFDMNCDLKSFCTALDTYEGITEFEVFMNKIIDEYISIKESDITLKDFILSRFSNNSAQ